MNAGDDEGQSSLRCNGCWAACDPKEHTVATKCGHLYCLGCCQTILESDDPTCPICNQLIQKTNIKAVHVLSASSDLHLALAGQAPEVVLSVANSAIQFYNSQQTLYARYAEEQNKRKLKRTTEQCRKKLEEVHKGYLNAKRKYQEVLAQKAALEEGNKELQDKYNQKAMQDKKLKEGFARVQQENEMLRRQVGMPPTGGGGMAANLAPAMHGMTAGSSGQGGGRASRAAMGLPMDTLVARPIAPNPSPLPSLSGIANFGHGIGYDTPDTMPAPARQMTGLQMAGSGGARRANGGHMLGGSLGSGGGLGGGSGLVAQLNMNGLGRQSLQNDKRQSLGMAFPGPNSLGTM